MSERFFFITNYDVTSATVIGNLLNQHPEIHCSISSNDIFLTRSSPLDSGEEKLIDNFVSINSGVKRFNGNISRFASFELQNRTLIERAKSCFRRANLVVSPYDRVNFLIKNWVSKSGTKEYAAITIEQQLSHLFVTSNHLLELYSFRSIYEQIFEAARMAKIDLDTAENKLFLIALAKVICFDAADLPTSAKMFTFDQLLSDKQNFIEFADHITSHKIIFSSEDEKRLESELQNARHKIHQIPNYITQTWQNDLIEKFTHSRLKTIYYPHINKPLSDFYVENGYESVSKREAKPYDKLISIQLNSNRPTQLNLYFDNIEETAENPENIEVLVNIDDDDNVMEKLLIDEQKRRKFTLKYVKTPRPASFCDLWKPINTLLEHTNPNSYFLLNISDEMLFATKGWDTVLEKYVGFFPDHLFRLRCSRNKFRNYFDRWECSFAQDSIPITTKRWVEVGGDWNPCFGPDSYQQLIAFYLAKEGSYSINNYLRELPVIDIQFHGDVPGLGIENKIRWKHAKDHINAMQICQSYRMQVEAKRRAIMIKANIIISELQLQDFEIVDDKKSKVIKIRDNQSNRIVHQSSYRLNRASIFFTNQVRKLRFNSYFGGGFNPKVSMTRTFLSYLKAKHKFFLMLYIASTYSPKDVLRRIYALRKGNALANEHKRLKELCTILQIENEKLQALLNEHKQ